MSGQVARSLSIIEMLAENPAGLSVDTLAKQLDLSKSIIVRICETLLAEKVIILTPSPPKSPHYRLSTKLVSLAMTLVARTGLTDVYKEILDDLAEQSGELVRFAALHNGELVWVTRGKQVYQSLQYAPERDHDRTAHLCQTSAGHIYLAQLPTQEVRAIIARTGIIPTEHPIGKNAFTSVEAILDNLEKARTHGYAYVHDCLADGMSAIAARITSPNGDTLGIVSLSGPSLRLTPEVMQEHSSALLATAKALSAAVPASKYFSKPGAATRDLGEAGIITL